MGKTTITILVTLAFISAGVVLIHSVGAAMAMLIIGINLTLTAVAVLVIGAFLFAFRIHAPRK